jgi:hypothetical protein
MIEVVEVRTDIWDYEVAGTDRPKKPRGKGCWAFAFSGAFCTMKQASRLKPLWATPAGMRPNSGEAMLYSEAKAMAIAYAKAEGFCTVGLSGFVWVLS